MVNGSWNGMMIFDMSLFAKVGRKLPMEDMHDLHDAISSQRETPMPSEIICTPFLSRSS